MKIKTNRYSVLGNYFLSLVIIGLVFIPFYSKGELELTINQFHHPFFDSFFSLVTHLGDGVILVIPLVVFIFHKSCHLVLLTLASAFHLGLVHVGKNGFFKECQDQQNFLKTFRFMKFQASHFTIGVAFRPAIQQLHLCLPHYSIWFCPKNTNYII